MADDAELVDSDEGAPALVLIALADCADAEAAGGGDDAAGLLG